MSASAGVAELAAFPGARTVAIIVATLGAEAGGTVLSMFSESEVEAIVREVKDMPNVPVAEVRELMGRLRDEAAARTPVVAGGVDKARQLLRRSHGAAGDSILNQVIASSAALPFEFLRGRRPEDVATHLTEEHPQVIALVLAHLPTPLAGKILEGLPADLRAQVVLRFANLEAVDAEVLAEVEKSLQRRIGVGAAKVGTAQGGVKPLAQLLNNVGREAEQGMLGALEQADPGLANAVRDLMFVFEDITQLDDRGLQEVLRIADAKMIALALKDANGSVRDKIERNLSQRAAEDVREYASTLGMVRRSDVAAAQREIVNGARKLEQEGRIVLMRGGGGGEGDGGEFI